jgi:aspartate/methionine/tyrosine aminotransferase
MNKNFAPFELERFMSVWEFNVDYNLSESGVHPLTIHELVEDREFLEKILNQELIYPQTNGIKDLRQAISDFYPGSTPEHVVVTTGAAQANFTSILTTLDPGDEIVIMIPNYMQIWGIAKNMGMQVKTFSLKEELGWKIDIDEFRGLVTNRTKLIAICNPNNPTGHIMTAGERKAVIESASRVGCWILTDEVYAGAEHLTDIVTPTLFNQYDRVIAVGSLSKAYGLPGLRIGWVVTTPQMAEQIWSRQDYITISTSILSNMLATYALSSNIRPKLLERTRKYIRHGYAHFEKWCLEHSNLFSFIQPQAAAIAFVRYHKKINSTELVKLLIQQKSTYVVPGDHFGIDHHLRISYGLNERYVDEGLSRIVEFISGLE